MKTIKQLMMGFVCLIAYNSALSQSDTMVLLVTKMHWKVDLPPDARAEFEKVEKEYFEKVLAQNEHVISSNMLTHYFSDDNTEVVFVRLYKNWAACNSQAVATMH